MRTSIRSLLILFLLFTLCNCASITRKPIEVEVVAAQGGNITIKKETMEKILSELIYQKSQLMECLEREKR